MPAPPRSPHPLLSLPPSSSSRPTSSLLLAADGCWGRIRPPPRRIRAPNGRICRLARVWACRPWPRRRHLGWPRARGRATAVGGRGHSWPRRGWAGALLAAPPPWWPGTLVAAPPSWAVGGRSWPRHRPRWPGALLAAPWVGGGARGCAAVVGGRASAARSDPRGRRAGAGRGRGGAAAAARFGPRGRVASLLELRCPCLGSLPPSPMVPAPLLRPLARWRCPALRLGVAGAGVAPVLCRRSVRRLFPAARLAGVDPGPRAGRGWPAAAAGGRGSVGLSAVVASGSVVSGGLPWSHSLASPGFPGVASLRVGGFQAKAMPVYGSMTTTPSGAAYLVEGVIRSPPSSLLCGEFAR